MTVRRTKALNLLLQDHSISHIARELKVTRQTIYRWIRRRDFQCALRKWREQYLKAGLEQRLNQ